MIPSIYRDISALEIKSGSNGAIAQHLTFLGNGIKVHIQRDMLCTAHAQRVFPFLVVSHD